MLHILQFAGCNNVGKYSSKPQIVLLTIVDTIIYNKKFLEPNVIIYFSKHRNYNRYQS